MTELTAIDIKTGLAKPAAAGEETAEIYRREARATVGQNDIATADALLDAAYANDRDEAPQADIERDLKIAAALAPQTPWVLEAAQRLMLKQGSWKSAIALLESCFAHETGENALAAALTIADLLWVVADDETAAHAWIKRAAEIAPNNIEALYSGMWMRSADPDSCEKYASALAKLIGSPEDRALLYGLAGSIEAACRRDVDALDSYSQAVQADRTNPYTQMRYALLCEKFGKLQEAAQAYAQLAAIFEDQELRGAFFRRAGMLQGYAGQTERCSVYLNESYKLTAGQTLTSEDTYSVMWQAADAMRNSGNLQRAAELERKLAEAADQDEARAAHYLALADACKDNDADDAVTALENASRFSTGTHAVYRLAAVYEAHGEYKKLAAILGEMGRKNAAETNAYAWLMADALWRCGEQKNAVSAWNNLKSGLGRIRLDLAYEETREDNEHARMLDKWYRETKDDASRNAILGQILTILTERIHAPEIAIQYLETLPDIQVSRELSWMQIRLFAQLSKNDRLVDALLRMAAETNDTEDALAMRLEAALLTDRTLGNSDRAADILRSIHKDDPACITACVLMHQIAFREGRWDLLLEANSWRSKFNLSAAQRTELACENAWACLQMNDTAGAIDGYEKALRISSIDMYAFRIYIDLLRRTGRWADIADVIRAYLPASEDSAQTDASLDNSDNSNIIQSDSINTSDNATDSPKLSLEQRAWRSMMLDIQTHCLRQTAPIGERQQLFESNPTIENFINYIIEKVASDSSETHSSAIAAARARLSGVSDEAQAFIDWAQAEVLRSQCTGAAAPKASAAIEMLLGRSLVMSYGKCLRLEILRCRREISHKDLVACLEQNAALTRDRWLLLALCREAMVRMIWIEHDLEPANHKLLLTAIREEPDKRTLWMLEFYSALTEDWQALGYFREKLAQLEVDTPARLQILKSALAPYIDAELDEHAVRVAQECLKLNAHAFPALIALANIAEDSGNMNSLAGIADRLSEASASAENRTSYGLWAAKLWAASLQRPDLALACLSRLLAHDPTCLLAIAMCENLYIAQDRPDLLSRIYARAIAALPEGKTQIELLRKQADILAEKLNDPANASLALDAIAAQCPNDLDALVKQADLLILQARWNDAVDTLEKISKCSDDETRRTANLKHADILVRQLGQTDRAKRLLRAHLNQYDHDITALNLLYEIACSEHNWSDAKSTLEEICINESSDDARRAHLAFTKVAREARWSHDLRTLYERQAIAAVLDSRSDFDDLVADYRAHGELSRLIEVTKREYSQQGNPEKIAKYSGCVAALLVANEQYREALSFLSDIIHDEQNTDWAYLARAQALTSAGQLTSAIGEYRRTLTRNIGLTDAYAPFIEVLEQTGESITGASMAAISALRRSRSRETAADNAYPNAFQHTFQRCIGGAPRGFFDLELIPLKRTFIEALRYLRMMTPYAFDMFSDGLSAQPLENSHWAYSRCIRLFSQNFEVKRIFFTKGLKHTLCRVKLNVPQALVLDESLLQDSQQIAFDFWTAYAMHQGTTGGALIDVLDDESVEALFCALCQAKPELPLAQTMKKQLFRLLPRTDRKLFKDGVPFLSPNWSDFRRALQTRASCIAAVMCGCPAYALSAHPGDEALEKFLISESYVRFTKMFWS